MVVAMPLPDYAMRQASFPESYERWLVGPLFRPWAEMTLDELDLAPGDRVLDVACGTGIVARVARERLGDGARIVGVDVSPDMLAVARDVAPEIEWREGDAAALPLRDGERFDVVVCQQGLQFMPDRAAAVKEMRRALALSGRLAVATWRPDEEMPFLHHLREVAERRLGPIADRRHGFGEAPPLEALLREAGLRDVRVRTVWRTIRFAEAERFVRMNTTALVGMSARGQTLTDAERAETVEAIVRESAPVLEGQGDGPGLAFDLATNLATGRR
jgi:ubiquinone/menaquinone biosynthesis C-methylase UbiE